MNEYPDMVAHRQEQEYDKNFKKFLNCVDFDLEDGYIQMWEDGSITLDGRFGTNFLRNLLATCESYERRKALTKQ